MTIDIKHWQQRLALLADKHGVPGATLAILADGEVADTAYGVLNRRTGVEATADSLFQIGSITKVWTATLVMQHVDEGLLDLDKPIVTYLPTFQVDDPEVTRTVTTRHLLAHTSGIDGDDSRIMRQRGWGGGLGARNRIAARSSSSRRARLGLGRRSVARG